MNFSYTEPKFTLHPVPNPSDASDTVGTLSQEAFKDLIGSEIDVIGTNAAARFILTEVTEKPKSQYPGQKRMPFSLILRGPLHIELDAAPYDLRVPTIGILPYIMLTRTIAYPDQAPGAYYEVIFC